MSRACIQDTLSSRALGPARASKGILLTNLGPEFLDWPLKSFIQFLKSWISQNRKKSKKIEKN